MAHPVHIIGSGLICARGDTPAQVASALWRGDYASGEVCVGERTVPLFALPIDETDWLERARLAIAQVMGAFVGIPTDTPLFVASSSFQIGHFERAEYPIDLPRATASFSTQIATWAGLNGALHSFSNACISGFSALDAAASLISAGLIDEAIVLGVELANRSTLAGFAAMELLSRTGCKPCAADRDGLVLGEAVAAIHLSSRPGPWRLAALRTGLDGYSMTGPDPEGGPIAENMRATLAAAGLAAHQIDLLKLQAAGSPGTDLAEARALRQVFGSSFPPALSFKPAFGHTLGASGIAELAALLACLDANQLPATANTLPADSEIGAIFPVDREQRAIKTALLNLIGFGGGLASLIVERTA